MNRDTPSGLGAPIRRVEDERLLTGRGHFVDDMAMPDMTYMHLVRSPHAHARILSVDTKSAAKASGVLGVYSAVDLDRENVPGLSCSWVPPAASANKSYLPIQPLLAKNKVRYVGDPVALVVADSLSHAKDAGELVEINYDLLSSVTLVDALEPDATRVWDDAESNVAFQIETGDGEAVDEQFAVAAHVTRIKVHYPRASANSMEPRSTLAYRDAMDGRVTLCSSAQAPHEVKEVISHVLGIPQLDLRVIAGDVGGAFGMKGQVYPEEMLVVWAANKVARPVKWTAERSESLSADMHGRHQIAEAMLALDEDGRILAFRTRVTIDVGAYLSKQAGVPPRNATISYPGTYHVPLIHAIAKATFTNTVQLGPYRGSGKPEATYVLERLVEQAAREMSIDPIEMRRRNLIRAADMPYQTPVGYIYDCGDFEQVLNKTLELADWNGFESRRGFSEGLGMRRGIGLALHCQRAGTFSERMEIRVESNGQVALHVGTLSTGQGHETMFAQMVSGWLGLQMSDVRVFQGDTDKTLFGRGTFAQRSMSTGGSALKVAADQVIAKGKRLSAWMLEASDEDIDFEGGMFRVAGTDRAVSFREVAAKSYLGGGLPSEFGVGLDGVGSHDGTYTFPNGCMICEVEVDTETGHIKIDRLFAIDDVGAVVNPLTLEGQLHGSISMGIGESLVEQVLHDRQSGQLLTGSFMDYAMPRADMMPNVTHDVSLVPTQTNLLGVKGGSEAGNCGVPPAVVHAVIDALSPWGITEIPLPATPERLWQLINAV